MKNKNDNINKRSSETVRQMNINSCKVSKLNKQNISFDKIVHEFSAKKSNFFYIFYYWKKTKHLIIDLKSLCHWHFDLFLFPCMTEFRIKTLGEKICPCWVNSLFRWCLFTSANFQIKRTAYYYRRNWPFTWVNLQSSVPSFLKAKLFYN